MVRVVRSICLVAVAIALTGCRSRADAFSGPGIARIAAVDVPLHDPLWSPDGKQLVATHTANVHTWSSEIYLIELQNGSAHAIEQTEYGNLEALAWSPDGKRIAVSSALGGEWPEAVWIVEVAGGGPRQYAAPGYDAAWSPDGSRIAVFSTSLDNNNETRKLSIISLTGSSRADIYDGTARYTTTMGMAWSPDGRKLAFSYGEQQVDVQPRFSHVDIYIMDISAAVITKVTSDGVNAEPRWSPDGNFIAYLKSTAGYPDSTLVVESADGRCKRALLKDVWSVDWARDGERLALGHAGEIYSLNLTLFLGKKLEISDLQCS